MAPFGKVHAAVSNAGDRVKAGLAWVNHRYQQGVFAASRINDYYHTGKKIAGLMMPVLDKIHPEIAPRLNAGLGAMDQAKMFMVSNLGLIQRPDAQGSCQDVHGLKFWPDSAV